MYQWLSRTIPACMTEGSGKNGSTVAVSLTLKVAYWISSNIAIAILENFSIAPPLVIALPTLR